MLHAALACLLRVPRHVRRSCNQHPASAGRRACTARVFGLSTSWAPKHVGALQRRRGPKAKGPKQRRKHSPQPSAGHLNGCVGKARPNGQLTNGQDRTGQAPPMAQCTHLNDGVEEAQPEGQRTPLLGLGAVHEVAVGEAVVRPAVRTRTCAVLARGGTACCLPGLLCAHAHTLAGAHAHFSARTCKARRSVCRHRTGCPRLQQVGFEALGLYAHACTPTHPAPAPAPEPYTAW